MTIQAAPACGRGLLRPMDGSGEIRAGFYYIKFEGGFQWGIFFLMSAWDALPRSPESALGFGAVEAYRSPWDMDRVSCKCASPGERGGAGGWRKLKVPAHRSHASVRGCLYNYRFLWFQSIFLQSSYRSSLTYRRCLRCSRCMRKRR